MRLSRSYPSNFVERRRRAFSLIELMVSISLTGLIVLVLYKIFDQTQRALRTSVKQVNVQELGAPALELISAELQTALSFAPFDPDGTNVEVRTFEFLPPFVQVVKTNNTTVAVRTNVIQTVWFLRRDKQVWIPTMYRFSGTTNEANMPLLHVGTLARFSTNFHATAINQENRLLPNFYVTNSAGQPLRAAHDWPRTGQASLAERVVHFKVTPLDADGRPYTTPAPTNYAAVETSGYTYYSVDSPTFASNVVVRSSFRNNAGQGGTTKVDDVWFIGRAMPAALEVELGVLEEPIYDQYRLLASDAAATGNAQALTRANAFLSERPEAVHVFRKRIPIASGQRDERLVSK